MTPKQLGYEEQTWTAIMLTALALIVVCAVFAAYVFLNFIGGHCGANIS